MAWKSRRGVMTTGRPPRSGGWSAGPG
jgi:hypothetical protein